VASAECTGSVNSSAIIATV